LLLNAHFWVVLFTSTPFQFRSFCILAIFNISRVVFTRLILEVNRVRVLFDVNRRYVGPEHDQNPIGCRMTRLEDLQRGVPHDPTSLMIMSLPCEIRILADGDVTHGDIVHVVE
jgi:hypothetical protein